MNTVMQMELLGLAATVLAFIAGQMSARRKIKISLRNASDMGVEAAWEIYNALYVINDLKLTDDGTIKNHKYDEGTRSQAVFTLRQSGFWKTDSNA